MKHMTLPRFWRYYNALPLDIQALADKNFRLLEEDPYHPSLHFKKVGQKEQLWSARVGAHYRALGREKSAGLCGSGLATMPLMINSLDKLVADLQNA